MQNLLKKNWKKIIPFCCVLFLSLPLAGNETQEDPLRKKAESGDAKAQFELGNEYFYGSEKRRSNPDLAVFWYRKAAAKNLPEAQLNYAICLERGIGCEPDPQAALDYYTFAAEEGLIPAKVNLALLLLHGCTEVNGKKLPEKKQLKPQVERAKLHLEELSAQKIPTAMVELAAVLLEPRSKPDEATQKKGFLLLKNAADLPGRTPKGLRMLADCYYGGFGVMRDPAQTVKYLELAVKQNDGESMAKLAYFYETGEVVAQDKKKAFSLFKAAAEKGVALAQCKYAEYIVQEYEPGKGLLHAVEWLQKSAAQDCPQALHQLGMYALQGLGLDAPDKVRAAELFFAAAKLGYPQSQYNLACMMYSGDGIPQNDSKAFYWFYQAAKRGHAVSMRRIAQCHYDGRGCEKDNNKALEWLKAAARAGDFTAQQMLRRRR